MVHNIPVAIVAGLSKQTRAIGQNNELLWHVPADLKRFKELTTGKPVIMGRKTYESILSILGKPLPNRTNIVVTRQSDYQTTAGVYIASTLEDAFELAAKENPTEIHIGGGAEMYRQAMPFVDKLYLTLFDDNVEGDAHFPSIENDFIEVNRSKIQNHNELKFEWVDYVRKQ